MNSRWPNFTQRRAVTISTCERDGVLCDSANASCAMLRLCDSVLSKAVIVQRRAVQHSGDVVGFLQHDVELFFRELYVDNMQPSHFFREKITDDGYIIAAR